MLSVIQNWVGAFRLRTLFLALACISMGTFLAAAAGKINIWIFLLSSLTATFLQILSNLSNDYGDSVHGADSVHRLGPKRAVQEGKISAPAMKTAMKVFVVLALLTGLGLLYIGLKDHLVSFLVLLVLGIASIVAAIKYTAGDNPYGYAGLGDISVFIFFGLVGVLGTYFLQAQTIDYSLLLPAAACGFFSVAVLNVNNVRDIESDKLAGKRSIPVRIGRKNARIYHWLLLIGGITCALTYTFLNFNSLYQFLFVLSIPLFIINGIKVATIDEPMELNPYLKQMSISTLVFVVTFGVGLLLSFSLVLFLFFYFDHDAKI